MNSACGLVIPAPLQSEGLRFEFSASVCFFALFFPLKEYVGNVQVNTHVWEWFIKGRGFYVEIVTIIEMKRWWDPDIEQPIKIYN